MIWTGTTPEGANGASSVSALVEGELAGKKAELFELDTEFKEGKKCTAKIVAKTQNISMNQRALTEKVPIVL